MAIWKIHDTLSVAIDDGVIRATDFAKLTRAAEWVRQAAATRENVIEKAREEAERCLHDAHLQARRIVDEAQQQLDEAYQAGLDRGMQEAAARWASQALEIGRHHRHALERQSERVAQLVSMAMERLLDEGDRASLFRRSLRTISRLLSDLPFLTMHVHQCDQEQARQALSAVGTSLGQPLSIEVVANDTVAPGTCRFESDAGVVDASLETQIAALQRAVQRAAIEVLHEQDRY